ncbi:MAG: hypothetical protein HPY44_08875 [Armatimonadetes bacterium]|nr:hypothetical protein [Armatimonadota bacterium]
MRYFLDELLYWYWVDPVVHSIILVGAVLLTLSVIGAVMFSPGRQNSWTLRMAMLSLSVMGCGYLLSHYYAY